MKRKSRSADVAGLVTHATTESPPMERVPPIVMMDRDDAGPDMPTERIDPAQLLGVSLLLAVGLSAPSLLRAVHGEVSLLTAAWYFGWAVIVSVLGVWLLWAVWHTYRRPIDEQRRHDWEQARVERLAAMEAENVARIEAARAAAEEAMRSEANALRTAAPPDVVELVPDAPELPRSLRDALGGSPAGANRPVALSDPSVGSR